VISVKKVEFIDQHLFFLLLPVFWNCHSDTSHHHQQCRAGEEEEDGLLPPPGLPLQLLLSPLPQHHHPKTTLIK
jgi:hypothetical protein